MKRRNNSVSEEFRVNTLSATQEELCYRAFRRWLVC